MKKTNTIIFSMSNKIIKRAIRSDADGEYVLHMGMKGYLEEDVTDTANYRVTIKRIVYYK